MKPKKRETNTDNKYLNEDNRIYNQGLDAMEAHYKATDLSELEILENIQKYFKAKIKSGKSCLGTFWQDIAKAIVEAQRVKRGSK